MRLNKFSGIVMKNAHDEYDRIMDKNNRLKAEKTEEKQNEFYTRAYHTIQAGIAAAVKKDNEKILQAELEAKRKLFLKREELIKDIFSEAENRLGEFKKTEEYAQWFEKKAVYAIKNAGDGRKTVYASEADKELAEQLAALSECADCEWVYLPSNEFGGGVRVKNDEGGILIDYSFEELLSEQKSEFLKKSGLVIE